MDDVSDFSFAISEHYEWQKTAMFAFSLEIFHVYMEDVFKRLIFMLVWAKAVQSYRHDSGWLHFSPSWFRKQPKLEVNCWTALMSRTRSWNWHRGAHLWKICFLVPQSPLCRIGWVIWAWSQRRSSPSEGLCPVSVLILYRFLWSTPQPEKLHSRKYGVTF